MGLISPKYVPARKSHLNFYKAVPLYYQNQSQDFTLYKPAGVKLSEMRINEERYPEKLFIRSVDKLRNSRSPKRI